MGDSSTGVTNRSEFRDDLIGSVLEWRDPEFPRASMNSIRDKAAVSAAMPWEKIPTSSHLTVAAKRISRTKP